MPREQRKAARNKSRVPVRVTRASGDTPVTGFTRDISQDGMFIQTHHPFPPGSRVEVELLYKEQPIAVSGIVVHASRLPAHMQGLQASGMGVKTLRPQETAEASNESEVTSPLPPTDLDSGRDERVDPSTRVAVFFGSERRLLALRSLSTSGAAIFSPEVLPQIPFVRLHFKLPGHPDLVVDGVPVRSEEVEGGVLVALKFLDPPPEVVNRIEEFVTQYRLRAQQGD